MRIKQQKLPKAVEEAANRANEMIQAMQTPAPESTDAPSAPVAVETPPVPEVKPEEPKVEVKPEAPQTTPPVVDKTQTVEYWEHRTKTIQGMFDAYKTRSESQFDALKQDLKATQTKLTETIRAVPVEYDIRKYFSEQEIEAHGEDHIKSLLKVAAKIAREQVVAERETLERDVNQKVENVQKQLEQTEQAESQRKVEQFWDRLNKAVPNWQQINTDVKFHNWLAEVEPYFDATRQELLNKAEQALDGNTVVAIFNGFLNTAAQAQTVVDNKLERKVVPDSIPSTTAPTTSEIVPISRADISRFYREKALGRYRGREQQAEAMEKKIMAAHASGKVF